uniref:CCHC-type domain-containing protein n=1 Tax=Tanacetum cinerariifolium TaxID=118510 RepID=A0A6L2JX61_TANCI|nr:hypothetical protein [Tanacetum cinerariifolium]
MVVASKVLMLKPDAKSLLQAVEIRFGGNAATKKTRGNLLKQQYENFTASSSEVLDQTFDRLQKLISQLEIHGESISQEYVNQKFLRSLSPEWNTYTIVWRNKPDVADVMLTMRARRFLKNTGKKFSINGNETIGFDKSKVKCCNCHKRGHFARECRAPRNQENRYRESSRRSVPVETPASLALVSCDGIFGYDWSDQAEEGPTNFTLMAYSFTSFNSEVSTDSICSSSCLENAKILKEQNEQLLKDLRTSKLNDITYKTGLESVEARLLVYKKNKSVYEEDFKCKTGLGYNAVPPPYTGNFMPSKPDLSFFGLEEFVNEPIVSEPIVKKPVVETSEAKASVDKPKVAKKNFGSPLIKDWISDSEDEAKLKPKIKKKTVKPSFAKIEFVKSKEQVKSHRKTPIKQDNQNRPKAVVNVVLGNVVNVVKASACWVWKPKTKVIDHDSKHNSASITLKKFDYSNPQMNLQDHEVIDNGCSRHMSWNMSYLTDYEEINGGYVMKKFLLLSKNYYWEVQLQALVDEKKVIITESTVRRDLQLEDAEGIDCLPNVAIFEQLTLMGIYVTPSRTKKIFGNIRRVGKGFSKRKTPLFLTMIVQAQEEMGEGLANLTDPHHTHTIIQPSTSQPQKKQKPKKTKRKDTELPQTSGPTTNIANENVNEKMDESLVRAATTASSLEAEQHLMNQVLYELVQNRVLDLKNTKTTQAWEIDSLKRRVKKLAKKKMSRTHKLKRLYKVGLTARVDSFNEASLCEDASKQGRIINDIDVDEGITLVDETAEY